MLFTVWCRDRLDYGQYCGKRLTYPVCSVVSKKDAEKKVRLLKRIGRKAWITHGYFEEVFISILENEIENKSESLRDQMSMIPPATSGSPIRKRKLW